MSFPAFWLPFLVAHTTALSPAAPPPEDAAPRLAAAVTSLSNAGYQLRDLETVASEDGIALSLVLAKGERAQALSVRFDEETGNFSGFSREPVPMPSEERHYMHAAALLEELSLSAPRGITFDCADFYLDFGSRAVSLAEYAFEVELRHSSSRPGKALSSWLRELLQEGELIDLRDERYDDGADVSSEVVFVIDHPEGLQELRVAVDEQGRPEVLSLVHSPSTEIYRRYPASEQFRSALDGQIDSLNFVFADELAPEEFDAAALDIGFSSEGKAGQGGVRIDMHAFEPTPFEGCGC